MVVFLYFCWYCRLWLECTDGLDLSLDALLDRAHLFDDLNDYDRIFEQTYSSSVRRSRHRRMILDRAAIDALDDEIQQAEIVLQQRRAFEIQKADTLSESFRLK